MRTKLKAAAFLLLPLIFGALLQHQLSDSGTWDRWQGTLGLTALAFLLIAAVSRELCRVLVWLPETTLVRAMVLGAYALAAVHAGFFFASWYADWMSVGDRHHFWLIPMALGVVALALLIAAPVKRLLFAASPQVSRWLLVAIAVLVLAHAIPAGSVLGFYYEDDPGTWYSIGEKLDLGVYAVPIFLGLWLLLGIAGGFRVRFTSPIPRFSLLTLLLIPCAGFSGVILHKHWLPWSLEKNLATFKEIENPWGSFVYPAAALSPDGSYAISSTEEGPALFWNCVTGESQQLRGNFGRVSAARFSPDGRYFTLTAPSRIALKHDGEHSLYRIYRTYKPGDPVVEDDIQKIYDANSDLHLEDRDVLWLFKTENLQLIAPLTYGRNSLEHRFSSDSQSLLAFNEDYFAIVFDTRTGGVLGHHRINFKTEASEDPDAVPDRLCVAIRTGNGSRVLLEYSDPMFGEFGIHTPVLPQLLKRMPTDHFLTQCCITPDGSLVLIAQADGTLDAVRVQDATLAWKRDVNEKSNLKELPLSLVRFDTDSIFVGLPTRLLMLSLKDGSTLETLPESKSPFATLRDRIDDTSIPTFVSPNEDDCAVFDWKSRRPALMFKHAEDARTTRFSVGTSTLSLDQKSMLECGSQGSVRLWKRRHSPVWWGRIALPEFWTTLLFTAALLWSILRDRWQNEPVNSDGAPARV